MDKGKEDARNDASLAEEAFRRVALQREEPSEGFVLIPVWTSNPINVPHALLMQVRSNIGRVPLTEPTKQCYAKSPTTIN